MGSLRTNPRQASALTRKLPRYLAYISEIPYISPIYPQDSALMRKLSSVLSRRVVRFLGEQAKTGMGGLEGV